MNLLKTWAQALLVGLLVGPLALGAPLVEVGTWTTANPGEASRGKPLLLKGTTDNFLYVAEIDATTGGIPVSGSISATTAYDRGPGGVYVATHPTYDTTTPANNRPLPTQIIAGDGLGPAAYGAGVTSALTQRVVVVTDQTAIPVTGTFSSASVGLTGAAVPASADFIAGRDGGGNLKAPTVTAGGAFLTDGSATTQPVSAASLPLPTGAATSALQTTGNTSLSGIATSASSIDTKTPALVSGRVPVDPSGVTSPVSVASLPLPTGASTAALQTTGNTSLGAIDTSTAAINGKTPALGQAAMAASVPVVLASNQSAIPVTVTTGSNGKTSALLFRNDYTGTPVTTAAYVQVVAATGTAITDCKIFDSSGSLLVLAVGAAAAEVDQAYIPPGGTSAGIPLAIPAGTRVSIKAVDIDATSGQIAITCLN